MPGDKQRVVANVRERKRTQSLNQAYKMLQAKVPKEPSDKMSKIHTLKLALAYIEFLGNLLKTSDSPSSQACGENLPSSTSAERPQGDATMQPQAETSASIKQQSNSPSLLSVCSPSSSIVSCAQNTRSPLGTTTTTTTSVSEEEELELEERDSGRRTKRARYEQTRQMSPPQIIESPPNFVTSTCYTAPNTISDHYPTQYQDMTTTQQYHNNNEYYYAAAETIPRKPYVSGCHEKTITCTYGQPDLQQQQQYQPNSQIVPSNESDSLRDAFREYRLVKRRYLRT